MRKTNNGKIFGDVSLKNPEKVKALSPVPGGVGPMTVASLFENLIQKYTNVFLYKLELKGKNEPIRLLNNWSKIREMETVWDYITDTLEKTILMPSDILVLFPNVKQYITAINYVFSKKLNQENKYQYSILDIKF